MLRSSDRPKSVRNRCVIEFFDDVFVLSCCPFDISVGIKAFIIHVIVGLSQITSLFLYVCRFKHNKGRMFVM